MVVFEPGSRVRIGPDRTILGEVSEVLVRPGGAVFYGVYYWSGLEPHFIELSACFVFSEAETPTFALGFNTGCLHPADLAGAR